MKQLRHFGENQDGTNHLKGWHLDRRRRQLEAADLVGPRAGYPTGEGPTGIELPVVLVRFFPNLAAYIAV